MNALEINNLQKIYKSNKGNVESLKGIDLTIKTGDFYALLGPNGAGKSTTIGVITTLIRPTNGSVKIFGYDLKKQTRQAKQLLGVVPQELNFNKFERVSNVLLTQASYYGVNRTKAKQRCEYLLKKTELWDKRDSAVMKLSGGMMRRLMVARALMHEPKLLLLDEPTAGVDIEIRESIWTFLREENIKGLSVLLTTHYLEEAEKLCNRVAIINKGEIIVDKSTIELLSELKKETVIFYLKHPIDTSFQQQNFDFSFNIVSDRILEVCLYDYQSVSQTINALAQKQIIVDRIKNKSGRLEQMFLNLVTDDKEVTSNAS